MKMFTKCFLNVHQATLPTWIKEQRLDGVMVSMNKEITFALLGVFLLQWPRLSQNNVPACRMLPCPLSCLELDATYKHKYPGQYLYFLVAFLIHLRVPQPLHDWYFGMDNYSLDGSCLVHCGTFGSTLGSSH
jgi:hypothetical protein